VLRANVLKRLMYADAIQMVYTILASLALGAVMTIGDWLWAVLQIQHTIQAGLAHGALMCLCLGAAIGLREGRVAAGAAAGPLIGVLAAGTFYLLAPALRMMAMFPAWMFFWICFALLQSRLRRETALGPAAVRGLAAAVFSGLAFYAISGIWTRHDPTGPHYLWNFAAWTFAFLPGFAVLFAQRGVRPGSDRGLTPV
jgi:hypothetical protein